MITKITSLPDFAIGFEASGKITKADYENILIPAVNEITKRTGQLYYLFVIKTGLKHFTAGALWHDLKVGLQHITKWKKMAIVSDSKGIKTFTDVIGYIVPGQTKGFWMNDLEAAKRWVSEK